MIYLVGDIHGVLGSRRLSPERFPSGESLTREDFVVVLGDFGLLWNDPPTPRERAELERIEALPWTTLFVDGNHENFALLDALPEEERWGAPVGVVSPHVVHLKRGYIYTLEGRRCFVFGGATSVDKEARVAGRSWWREEIPSREEFDRGRTSLDAAGWSVDWVLTHTAPNHVVRELNLGKYFHGDPVSDYLDEIHEKVSYERWFCGHLHRDRVFEDGRLVVLGEGIADGETGTVIPGRGGGLSTREAMRRLLAKLPREGD